jgi:hypothetical protein
VIENNNRKTSEREETNFDSSNDRIISDRNTPHEDNESQSSNEDELFIDEPMSQRIDVVVESTNASASTTRNFSNTNASSGLPSSTTQSQDSSIIALHLPNREQNALGQDEFVESIEHGH